MRARTPSMPAEGRRAPEEATRSAPPTACRRTTAKRASVPRRQMHGANTSSKWTASRHRSQGNHGRVVIPAPAGENIAHNVAREIATVSRDGGSRSLYEFHFPADGIAIVLAQAVGVQQQQRVGWERHDVVGRMR